MKKEKHIVNNVYGNHQLSRYIDVYEVSANRCHSVPESGYKGTEATLVDDPAWNEKFSSYSITGAVLTGNNFIIDNDVTAQANYETAKNVTTIRCNSTKNSGFIGDTASLSNSPAWNEKFNSYSITGSTLTGSNFTFTGSDITAQANFETAKNVTLQTDGHGTIASTKNSGFINDTATLSNTASNGYGFSGYSITGATLTGSNFKFTGSNITAKAWFSAVPQYVILYSSNPETAGTSITHNFSVSVPTGYPYVAVRFDVKDGGGYIYNYMTRQFTGPFSYIRASMGNNNYTPVCNMDWDADESTALNQQYATTANTTVGAAQSKNCLARNTSRLNYNTINYVWRYNGVGFSAGVNGIWRYRDSTRNNTFTSISNYSWTQSDKFGDEKVQLYTKNLRIGLFNSISDALSTAW